MPRPNVKKKLKVDFVWLLGSVITFFHNQPVYKHRALEWQMSKQLLGLKPLSLSNNKNYRLRKVEFILSSKYKNSTVSQKYYLENFRITHHEDWFWILKIVILLADIDHLVKLLSNHYATLSPKSHENISLVPSVSFRYKRKAKKRLWNTSNTRSKFAQIEGMFLRISYGIRGWRYWKYQHFQARNLYV